jgi:hypothetical protein
MSRTIRTYDAFYEAEGPYAVSKVFAESIFRGAADKVARHTGPIALASVRGVRLPLEPAAIDISKVGLGSAPYTLLMTRRRKEGLGSPPNGRTLVTKIGTKLVEAKTLVTTPLRAADDPSGIRTQTAAVHELGHSFGLVLRQDLSEGQVDAHCLDQTCIMAASPVVEVVTAGEAFCEPCAGDLELAGFAALAAQL